MRLLITHILLLLLLAHAVRAQRPFQNDVWLTEPGVPVGVNAIAPDAQGGFCIAANGGMLYFDGRRANIFDTLQEAATAAAFGGDILYYGLADGKVYRRSVGRRHLLFTAGAPVLCLRHTAYGMFIGTEGDGLYLLTPNNALLHFTTEQGLPDNYIYTVDAHDGQFLIGSDLGFHRGSLQNGKLAFKPLYRFQDITRVVAPAPDKAAVWIGFQERGVALVYDAYGPDARVVAVTDAEDWNFGQVNAICPLSATAAAVATSDGYLLRVSLRGYGLYADTLLHIERPISCLRQDHTGNLWAGTERGLTQVSTGHLYGINLKSAFSEKKLNTLAVNNRDELYYNQDNELWRCNPYNASAEKLYTFSFPVNCIYPDERGNVWVGTSGNGLWVYNGKAMRKATELPALQDGFFLSLSGKGNRMWLSTLGGVEEVAVTPEGTLQAPVHYGRQNGLGSDIVYKVFPDREGRLWFATDGAGIYMRHGHKISRVSDTALFKSGVVYGLAQDSFGRIWAATLKDGILMLQNGKWYRYGKGYGLEGETVTALTADNAGHVYAASVKGIDKWYPSTQTFRHVNARSTNGPDSFSTALNALVTLSNGDVMAPYDKGFLLLKNEHTAKRMQARVRFTGAELFFVRMDELPRVLPHNQNHVTFRYRGINFIHAERLHYRYRLQGLGNDWITTSDESVTYPNLPPGDYVFTIQASLDDRFARPSQLSYAFTIKTPYWSTLWFWALILSISGAVVIWLTRRRIHALQKMAQMRQEKMAFEYEHLKSQVNPHFLFNSLNTLAALIEEAPDAAVNYTHRLSELYRDTLAEQNEKLITIADEFKMLQRYTYIQKTRFGDALQLRDELTPAFKQSRRIMPFALQLLVENAIKHNVVSREAPLVIFIEQDGNNIVVRNRINAKKHKEKGVGIGLKNIRLRYKLLTDKNIETLTRNDEFIVKLPLI